MYLVYQPEGAEEPTRFKYLPNKVMSADREMLERRTERNFSQFTKDVVEGNSLCRRALLFMFLRKQHRGTRFEDVDFAWDELRLEYSKGELRLLKDSAADSLHGDQLATFMAAIDDEIENAYDDGESGKALPPIVG